MSLLTANPYIPRKSLEASNSQNQMANELERQLNIITKHPSLTQRFIEISNLITTLIGNHQTDNSSGTIQPYIADIDKMTSVRILIKYLHYYANSFVYSPVNLTNHYQRDIEMKQAVWISKYPLQKTFYTFIKTAFQRWPMDYTFRQPLETWLSYIQPWRYVDIFSNSETLSRASDHEEVDGARANLLINSPSIDNNWRNFMSDNLLFYTVMFGRLISRLLQLDLSSSRNALMLYRVIKVYSQPGFLDLLREAEETVCRSNMEQKISLNSSKSSNKLLFPGKSDSSPSRAKLLAPTLLNSMSTSRWLMSIFKHPLMELESEVDYDYVSLFSPQMKQQLAKLLQEVHKSRQSIKEFVHAIRMKAKVRNKSFLQSIQSFFLIEDADFDSRDEREMHADKLQADDHLLFVSGKVIQCFGIPTPDDVNSRRTPNNSSSCNISQDQHVSFIQADSSYHASPINLLKHRAGKHLSSTPKADLGRSPTLGQTNSSSLSPIGKYPILNKMPKSEYQFEGNPDLQPVRSFELQILVTFFMCLSQLLNEKYGASMQRLYQEDSFSGWLARFFLHPPTDYIEVERLQNSLTSRRTLKHLQPRVNLRFFAQRRVIIALTIFIVLLYFYL